MTSSHVIPKQEPRHLGRWAVVGLIMVAGTSWSFAQNPPMPSGSGMQGMQMMAPKESDSPSTKAYKAAMMKMMSAMPQTFANDADIDFMTQMRAHHQGAIDMANVALTHGKDAKVKDLAREIVAAQQKEIAMIDAWLKAKGR